MVGRNRWVDRNSPADHIESRFVTTTLVRNHPEQMQAVGMARIQLQNPAVKPIGFVQSSGPLMLQRTGE